MKLDHNRRSEIGRESIARARGKMRCPTCYAVKDHLPKGFACSLSRWPRVFRNIAPPINGSQPAVTRVEG